MDVAGRQHISPDALSEIWRNRQFQGRSESAIANTWLMEASTDG